MLELMEEAPSEWAKSCVHLEDSIHQLSPYIGKLKSSIAKQLIAHYSKKNEIIIDPFSGSGTVPYQAILMGSQTFASDISIYAKILSKAKLSAPATEEEALDKAKSLIEDSSHIPCPDIATIPDWVKQFFHPKTLEEIIRFSGRSVVSSS